MSSIRCYLIYKLKSLHSVVIYPVSCVSIQLPKRMIVKKVMMIFGTKVRVCSWIEVTV